MPCTNHPEVMEGLNSCTRCARKFCGDCLVELKGGSFCAACKSEEVKDIQSGVGDPKELVLAGFWRRFWAYFVDNLLYTILVIPFLISWGLFDLANQTKVEAIMRKMQPLALIVTGVILAYEGILLQVRGQTLGKMAMGIKVVNPDGSPIAGWQAWLRPAVRLGFGLVLSVLGQLIDCIPAAFTAQKTSIHDMVAKTRVIRLRS
jgi:uncharacterized RDD family membrane protein YckC